MCGGKSGEIHAERHSYLRDQPPQDGAVQDQGEQVEHVGVEVVQGGGGEERVGGGEGPSKPSRRPVNWSVPRRRGLIPDGLVQARLSNFVVKFPNLGRVGSCNNNTSVGAKKTASCQLEKVEISGGKRK